MKIIPSLAVTLAFATAAASFCACTASSGSNASSASALSGALTITGALTLSASGVAPGHAVQATVTYANASSSPVTVQAAVIAARPPGGSHAGGPYDDFQPYAPATTLAPGETLTVRATRTFASDDPTGNWDVYPTYQDDSGAWHDGPDQTLVVGSGGGSCDADASAPDAAPSADAGDAGGAPLVVPPIAGATRGQWQPGTINGMPYQMLLPAGYSNAHSYPLIVYLHQLDNASQIPSQIDPWFNDLDFRSRYPAIVVAPQCVMDADPSGQTINWGGVSNGDQPCQDNAMALVDQVMSTHSVFAPKVYVTGNSMGGIGSWDFIIKYNAKSPTIRPVFAAALILAGAAYDWGYPSPDADVVARLKDVPIWAIHGGQDTQVPLDWDKNMFAAEQAAGGSMKLIVDANEGHDVWDTYYSMPKAATYWSWLFAQKR